VWLHETTSFLPRSTMRNLSKIALLGVAFLVLVVLALKGSALLVPSGTWAPAANLAEARAGASAALLADGHILITGGEGASGPLASAELFGMAGGVSPAAPMNVARSKHVSVTLPDGRVLVAGGVTTGGGATNAAELYDPASSSWSSLAGGMTEARSGATAAVLQDGRVLIAGGDSAGVASASIEIFDPAAGTFSFAGALSSPRENHALALLADGRVLIIGGSNGSAPLASSEIFDPVAGVVAPGPSLAAPRSAHSATTLLDGRVLVAGGSGIVTNADGSTTPVELASAEIYDPSVGTFSPVATTLAAPRQGHLAFLLPHNNNVLIVGGTSAGVPVAASELFTPWQGTFASTGALTTARTHAAGNAMQQDGLLLLAGGSDANAAALSSTELYGFATVKTDQADYSPGTVVTITGSGWQPGETVTLTLVESPLIDTHTPLTAVADANGNIFNDQFIPNAQDVGVRFYLTASGASSQAQTTFTDTTRSNSTTVSCSSPITFGGSTTCTATVTDTDTGGGSAPKGTVSFTTSGSGTFTTSPCTLAKIGTTNDSNCSVSYSPSSVGTGTHTITATFTSGSGDNHTSGTSGTFALTVNKATATVTLGSLTATYDGTPKSATATTNPTGLTVSFTYNGSATAPTNAGSYTVVGTVVDGNYQGSATGTLGITARPVTVKATSISRVYGDSTPAFSILLSVGSLGSGDTLASLGAPSFSTDPNPGVGTHAITVSGLSNANYAITYDNTGVLTVTARPITVKADAVSRVYGESTPAFSISLSAGTTLGYTDTLASLGTPSFSISTASPGVGTYPITVSGLSNANYTITYDNTGVLTVTARPITVKANAVSRVYGESTPAFSISVTAGTFGYLDNLASLGTPSFSTDPNPGVGTHAITVSGLSNANYAITYDNTGVLTVTARPVTVTADAKTKTYGNADPALTYQITSGSLAFSDAFSGSLTRAAGEGVGTYAITQGTLALSGNYDLTYMGANLTITARVLTVGATGVNKVYDGTTSATVTLTDNRVLGDVFTDSYTSASFADKNVGTGKAVSVSGISISGADAGNYSLSNTTASTSADITPKPAAVTPAAASKIYGSADPLSLTTGTLSGFVAADGITASYSRTAGETVAGSPYTISATLSPASALSNYTITYNTANFTISKASTTVSLSITPAANNGPGSYILNTLQTFSVTVAPQFAGTPTGTVTLKDSSTTIATITLSGGGGSITNSTLVSAILGAHSLSAVYYGDDNFITSTSSTNTFIVGYAAGGTCYGDAGHQILQPINANRTGTMENGTSVWKQGSTVPAKFRVCDVSGKSIGTPGVIYKFVLYKSTGGTVTNVDEPIDNSTNDLGWRFDPTAQQWIFNMTTKVAPLNNANTTYYFRIDLNDGSSIYFNFGLK